jgi:hypothetical protein
LQSRLPANRNTTSPINSDLTVSCNCQDYDGSGHLGDLRKNSFEEIFFGPVAQKFRDDLAKGKFRFHLLALRRFEAAEKKPRAAEVATAASRNASGKHGHLQRGLHRLRARGRGERARRQDDAAGRVGPDGRPRGRLKMERIFYLNLGEPFLSPTICQELPLLRSKNPDAYIRVSTNGILLNTDAKREAALNLSDIQFSVHGISDAMCEKYMMRGSFEKAFDAMKKMAGYRDARGLKMPFSNGNIFCSTGTIIRKQFRERLKWRRKPAWTSFRSGRRIIRFTECHGVIILVC